MMNVGIIGNGSIVKVWIEGAIESKVVNICSAYVRREEKKTFFEEAGIENIHTDLDAFLADPQLEVVYIALPNSLHYEFALKALRAGKHVHLEKPFTTNKREALHLFQVAEKNNVFIFEGICNIYDPNFLKMKEIIKTPSLVYSTFNQLSSKYKVLMDGGHPNVFNPDFSGGVLMDLIVYQLHACYSLFGKPKKISYFPKKHSNGIDLSGTAVLQYDNFNATLIASKEAESDDTFVSINAEQSIITHGGISLLKGFYINGELESYNRFENYFANELVVFEEVLRTKDDKRYMKMKETTLAVMEMLDDCRKSGDIEFKNDKRELL